MNSKQTEEFKKVVLELDKYNLNDHVSLGIGDAENESGKKTKHIYAYWLDTVAAKKSVDMLHLPLHYILKEVCKCEEMNKFFSGELFAEGVNTKVAWIKADHEDKIAYLKAEPNGHPALFPAWLEGNKELVRKKLEKN